MEAAQLREGVRAMPTVVTFMVDALSRFKWLKQRFHFGTLMPLRVGASIPLLTNNHLENLMRPWAMGRRAWLFAGSELAGQRAAVVMSLMQSAKLHGRDPHTYLNDVLTRLPTHPNRRIYSRPCLRQV